MTDPQIDTFARDRLPPPQLLPEILLDQPFLQFPAQLNCAVELLDRHVAEGRGERVCLRTPEGASWSYAELQARVDRIAHVLVRELGLVPGNRVLLRGPNNPMMAACWFAVVKAGGIAVSSMPLLRAVELEQMIDKAQISHALCDLRLVDELRSAAARCPTLKHLRCFHDDSADGLESAMARHDQRFDAVPTAADSTCVIAFTSGTTGKPKGTMHFHRDVMAACACWPPHVLRATADDVFIGSPPLAFTFGLGGLLLFPMSIGASTVLTERVSPPELLDAALKTGATVLFTAPTSYRALALSMPDGKLPANQLRKCVSAGEALPGATRALWRRVSGIEIIDGIGSTELFHIFISADEQHARDGATGKPVPGYVACIMDADGKPLPAGEIGALAVKGPTGCKYLDDPRQTTYVRNGWNYTGDAYLLDADGYFHFQSRTDDMIVSAGYNISGPEVEEALLRHPAVAECGVIGSPDPQRGQIVHAFVVLKPGHVAGDEMVRQLQDHVKQTVAPYKYPRAIEFRSALPRTETGKLQRFKLRQDS